MEHLVFFLNHENLKNNILTSAQDISKKIIESLNDNNELVKNEFESMSFFMLVEMVLGSMSAISGQAGRLGYYFLPLCFIYISYFL